MVIAVNTGEQQHGGTDQDGWDIHIDTPQTNYPLRANWTTVRTPTVSTQIPTRVFFDPLSPMADPKIGATAAAMIFLSWRPDGRHDIGGCNG